MRKLLYHLNFSLALAMLVLIYVDNRNPMMGFLSSPLGYGYLFAFAGLTAVNCGLAAFSGRKKHRSSAPQEIKATQIKTAPQTKTVPKTAPAPRTNRAVSPAAEMAEARPAAPAPKKEKSSSDFNELMSEIDKLLS